MDMKDFILMYAGEHLLSIANYEIKNDLFSLSLGRSVWHINGPNFKEGYNAC